MQGQQQAMQQQQMMSNQQAVQQQMLVKQPVQEPEVMQMPQMQVPQPSTIETFGNYQHKSQSKCDEVFQHINSCLTCKHKLMTIFSEMNNTPKKKEGEIDYKDLITNIGMGAIIIFILDSFNNLGNKK